MKKQKQVKTFEVMGIKFQIARDKLSALFEEWVERLHLDRWEWDLNYVGGSLPSNPDTLARISSAWQYRTANVEFFLPVAERSPDDYLEYGVVHELCHAMVNPMSRGSEEENAVNNEEQVVSDLARALIRAKYSSDKLAKK